MHYGALWCIIVYYGALRCIAVFCGAESVPDAGRRTVRRAVSVRCRSCTCAPFWAFSQTQRLPERGSSLVQLREIRALSKRDEKHALPRASIEPQGENLLLLCPWRPVRFLNHRLGKGAGGAPNTSSIDAAWPDPPDRIGRGPSDLGGDTSRN